MTHRFVSKGRRFVPPKPVCMHWPQTASQRLLQRGKAVSTPVQPVMRDSSRSVPGLVASRDGAGSLRSSETWGTVGFWALQTTWTKKSAVGIRLVAGLSTVDHDQSLELRLPGACRRRCRTGAGPIQPCKQGPLTINLFDLQSQKIPGNVCERHVQRSRLLSAVASEEDCICKSNNVRTLL